MQYGIKVIRQGNHTTGASAHPHWLIFKISHQLSVFCLAQWHIWGIITGSSYSLGFVNFTKTLQWALLSNPLKTAVISGAIADLVFLNI